MSSNEQNQTDGSGEAGFDPDDPRLTAYALGALDGDDLSAVDALLDRDPDARAFVEGLSAAAAALETEYSEGSGDALLASQRERALTPPGDSRIAAPSLLRRVVGWSSLAAAGLAVVGGALFFAGDDRPAVDGRQSQAPFTYALFGDPPEDTARPSRIGAGRLNAADLKKLRALGYLAPGSSATAPSKQQVTRWLAQTGYAGDPQVTGGSQHVYRAVDAKPDWNYVDPELRKLFGFEYDPIGTLAASRVGERYTQIPENPFRPTTEEPRSTFSIDVDTASYANVRRYLTQYGQFPPPSSVRIEEFINYFTYDYPQPDSGMPFSVTTEVARCPWKPEHRLVLVGIQGKTVSRAERDPANLVFLIDVSGSMKSANKLPLLQSSLRLLVEQMGEGDRIAIVVYAGSSGLVLPSTPAEQEGRIMTALTRLSAGGSTNGGAGVELAYRVAGEHFIEGGVNRVILCTDGDFNVGVTSRAALTDLIEEKRDTGVFLSVLGFGGGNVKDDTMELLADKGNGNYAYIDTMNEARKVLVEQMNGTLQVIAKDVKIQVEFNPATVGAWRLIGYENRILAHQDFNDDQKDAGDVGAGSSVTALYQVAPVGVPWSTPEGDESRYSHGSTNPATQVGHLDELLFLRLRYKAPDGDVSQLIETPVRPGDAEFRGASRNLRFASSVAGFAMLLRGSAHAGNLTADRVRLYAQESVGEDREGYRREFLTLVDQARGLLSEE